MENLMNSNLKNTHPTDEYYTPIQLKLPLDLETLISLLIEKVNSAMNSRNKIIEKVNSVRI